MNKKIAWSLSVLVLLTMGLSTCDESGTTVRTTEPLAVASPQPSATPAEVTVTSTQVPPTASPTTGATQPAATSTLVQPTAEPTSTPLPPSATAMSTPLPTQERPTPTPLPTALPPAPTVAVPDPAAVEVTLQPVAGGLDTPVGIANAGDGSGRLFVLEKIGRIRVVQNGALAAAPFLDITDRVGAGSSEQGLLGLAFHPRYAQNGFLFVNYTDRQGNTVVSRFSAQVDPGRADPASEVVLLTLEQPASNHNGGHLAFGPDGYLYIGTGDGGGAGDRYDNGQNGQTLLGAMLRLDVDSQQPYALPGSNPFIGVPGVRDEIWALGLRNPWRYSFDRITGDLYIADVGQNMYEEVNFQPASDPGGQNYGWPIMEGLHCFPADRPCDRTGLTLPVREYDHTQGCSVTGGYVYRGQESPLLTGIYLFGDYCSGRIWGLAQSGDDGDWRVARLAQADVRLSAFGEDEQGELYLVDMDRGELFKIVARPR
ncbi:MAG: PQQ-dependent sugar dehydrogenase [Anaerolineae bacterium]